jgi:hypothetical protein
MIVSVVNVDESCMYIHVILPHAPQHPVWLKDSAPALLNPYFPNVGC